MIMGMVEDQYLEWVVEYDIEFYVFELDCLEVVVRVVCKVGKKVKVYVEVEIGMNCIGYEVYELFYVVDFLLKYFDLLQFKGLCIYFVGVESIVNYVWVM